MGIGLNRHSLERAISDLNTLISAAGSTSSYHNPAYPSCARSGLRGCASRADLHRLRHRATTFPAASELWRLRGLPRVRRVHPRRRHFVLYLTSTVSVISRLEQTQRALRSPNWSARSARKRALISTDWLRVEPSLRSRRVLVGLGGARRKSRRCRADALVSKATGRRPI